MIELLISWINKRSFYYAWGSSLFSHKLEQDSVIDKTDELQNKMYCTTPGSVIKLHIYLASYVSRINKNWQCWLGYKFYFVIFWNIQLFIFSFYFCVLKKAPVWCTFVKHGKVCLFENTFGIKAFSCIIMTKSSLELRKCNCFSKLKHVEGFIS